MGGEAAAGGSAAAQMGADARAAGQGAPAPTQALKLGGDPGKKVWKGMKAAQRAASESLDIGELASHRVNIAVWRSSIIEMINDEMTRRAMITTLRFCVKSQGTRLYVSLASSKGATLAAISDVGWELSSRYKRVPSPEK